MIYWRQKKDNGDGDLEDFFPGDVIELAESKQELARKVQKRRLRWPDHVFDDVLGASPCEEELSQKERKKRKEVAKRKEMETMSMDWPADDEAGHEPEKNGKYARLEQEIISLRKKLVEERKRNQDLQDVVVKGMVSSRRCQSQVHRGFVGQGRRTATLLEMTWLTAFNIRHHMLQRQCHLQ
ncbi:hypothetical protein MRX96_003296 [Rhipicephalus microplus]